MSGLARGDVEDFLFFEAALLDDWRLEEWLGLWTEDGRYLVPATDAPYGDPSVTLALVADDLTHLRSRVDQLLAGTAWAEVPRSRTRRMITNVRILERSPEGLVATSNVIVHRFRHDRMDVFVGTYEHRLSVSGAVKIREKKVILGHETLGAQGAVSILL